MKWFKIFALALALLMAFGAYAESRDALIAAYNANISTAFEAMGIDAGTIASLEDLLAVESVKIEGTTAFCNADHDLLITYEGQKTVKAVSRIAADQPRIALAPLTFAAAATTANCDGADFLFWLSGAQAGDQYNAQDFTAVYSEEQGATLTLTLK